MLFSLTAVAARSLRLNSGSTTRRLFSPAVVAVLSLFLNSGSYARRFLSLTAVAAHSVRLNSAFSARYLLTMAELHAIYRCLTSKLICRKIRFCSAPQRGALLAGIFEYKHSGSDHNLMNFEISQLVKFCLNV